MIKLINTPYTATFDKAEVRSTKGSRLFVATISINNNVSEWVELK